MGSRVNERLIAFGAMVVVCLGSLPARAADGPTLRTVESQLLAKAALLYDPQAHRVIFARNPDEPFMPASTVKLLTALLVYELTGLDGTIKVTQADTKVVPSHVPLIPGETVRVRDMVKVLLIGSANDSAMALARHVAGSAEAFGPLATERARRLGCTNTRIVNPHGLTVQGQYTTANDLLKIFQKVLTIPELREMAQTPRMQLVTRQGAKNVRNHNRLLGQYEGMGPAKTGWTIAARHTYAASATRNGRELQLIILNSPNKWTDARLLFDYGFANLPPVRSRLSEVRPELAQSARRPNPPRPERTAVSAAGVVADGPPPGVEVAVPVEDDAGSAVPVARAIPAPATGLENPAMARPTRYRVQRGDTIYRISRRFGVSMDELVRANELTDPDRLIPGTELVIP